MACWNYMVELIVIVFVPINGSIVLPGWVSKSGLLIGEQIWRFNLEFCQSKARQFTFSYCMFYSQIAMGNVTLPITLLSTK